MTTHSAEYRAYLKSPQWQRTRLTALVRARQCCERCRRFGGTLQVHHKTYDRLGHESPADLVVLCLDCHAKADQERKEAAVNRRAFAWAAKVYGEHWRDRMDEDDVIDAFADWLEGQQS